MYTKNHDPWASSDSLTTTVMDNFETIYDETADYIAAHTHDESYYTRSEMEARFWYAGNDGPGSGADADLIYHSSGLLHATSFVGAGVPIGLIILWYGSVAAIPAGWHLCDGTAGTTNLLNRFPVGAGTGSSFSVGDTGGSTTFAAEGTFAVETHALSISEMPAHTHPFTEYYSSYVTWDWIDINANTPSPTGSYGRSGTTSSAGSGTAHGHTGSSASLNSVAAMPYYYSLCYIQKI